MEIPANLTELMTGFAQKHPLASIATVSVIEEPSISSVYVFPKGDFTFYFGTRTETQKFKDIASNPTIAVAFSDADTLETLQMRGKATSVLEADTVRDLLATLRDTYNTERKHWATSADKTAQGIYHMDVSRWIPPVAQMNKGSYAFFKIIPEWARYRRYDADWKEGKDFTEFEYRTTN